MASPAVAEAVERSAAPPVVAVALDRLTEAHPGLSERLITDARLREAVVAVAGASRSLTDLCVRDPEALSVLADLDRRQEVDPSGDAGDLARWKKLELLRVAARDLLDLDGLPEVGRALAAMASEVLADAHRLAGAPDVAVIGMGKLGGSELNYASDVDVVFVGEGDVRPLLAVARSCFRVDVDLRPEGRDGPLVRSLESYEAYWDRWAKTWEFQALLKARAAAGDAGLGRAFMAAAGRRLWERPFTADDVHAVRAMKARAEGELARRGLTDREVKRGRGGIRDVEFAVQLLQLVHGRRDPEVRSATTLVALAQLASAGYIDPADGAALEDTYRFLRTVEHRLQLLDEQQVHALPTSDADRGRLARIMGYRDEGHETALEQLDAAVRRHQSTVRGIHERLFFRPLLEAFTATTAVDDTAAFTTEVVEERLAAFGFADAERTRQAVRELTRGLTRSSRLMQQLLPLLLEWLSQAPDPDRGLLGLRKLSSGPQRVTELVTAFRESPEAARRLCMVLGTSPLLARTLEHQPELVPALGDDGALAPRTATELGEQAATALSWRPGLEDRQLALLRFRRREELRIAARDVLGLDGDGPEAVAATGAQLTALAEACMGAAVEAVSPSVPMAVISMGRFGGAELSYASDLDILLVYRGSGNEDFARAEQAAEALLGFMGSSHSPQRIWATDLDLRPEGKQGPLARSLDAYRAYYQRWGQTWERQALLRARPVAGDRATAEEFCAIVDEHLWGRPLESDEVREIRRIKARVERERLPAGDDPQYHLKLGRGSLSDVEFTVQMLQLRHRVAATGTMAAIEALGEAGALAEPDGAALRDAYRFCERTRNRWYLVKGAPGDALPSQPELLSRLARSLGTSSTDLREEYRRVTRRARSVVERLFYGKSP